MVCVQAPLDKGAMHPPLVPKEPANTHMARTHARTAGWTATRWMTGHEERTVRKMKEILEQLWRDFCFEQNIESGPICMADVADFFDFVELMTDTFSDDRK